MSSLQTRFSSTGLAVVILFVLAAPVRADLTLEPIGSVVLGGSWYQDFHVTATTPFANLGMSVGASYPALQGAPSMDFSFGGTAGWSEVYGPPSGATWPIAASAGPTTTELNWRAHFADPLSQTFTLSLFAYDTLGSNAFEGAEAYWDGTVWSITGVPSAATWEEYQSVLSDPALAPVPSAAFLAAVGFA
ncbi:MAG: hypothetical protein ACE5HE_15155, partial [Phycisphaerae bacterium]